MRALVLGFACVGLAACQTTASNLSVPRPVAAPIETAGEPLTDAELRGTVSPERLKINACLTDIGLLAMPEGFAQTAPPMTLDQNDAFQACMARSR
jgi:hypothetical protein